MNSASISDEIINAFIDNELEDNEYNDIIQAAIRDKVLKIRINQARELKALVKMAQIKNPPNRTYYDKTASLTPLYIAASVIFMVTSISLLITQYNGVQNTSLLNTHYKNKNTLLTTAAYTKNSKVALQLLSSDPVQINKLFNLIDSLLIDSRENKNSTNIEVILSGAGINILRKDLSNYMSAIKNIVENNHNVTFIACGNTLKYLQDKSDKEINIMNEAMLVSSGHNWAEKRKQQGWTSISI